MKEELRKKLWKKAEYNWPENNEEDCNLANAYMMGAFDLLKELWHNARKEMPKDGSEVLILSLEMNLYLCRVCNGDVISGSGHIWNKEITHWLDTDDLFEHKED